MEPNIRYPFNVRSFFTDREKMDIGGGLEIWRGYFQSIRPAIGKMVVNLDISSGVMYKSGPLIDLCLRYLNKNNPNALSPSGGFPERERLRLQRFIANLRITTRAGANSGRPRAIKKLTQAGASSLRFERDGKSTTVTAYFQQAYNTPVRHPNIVCVEVCDSPLPSS